MKRFAELTGKEKCIELLRSILVPPLAWLGERVGDGLMYLLVVRPFMRGLTYEGTDRWLRHLIGGSLGGAAFIIVAAKTAPRFRLTTAIVLAVLSIAWAVRVHREDTIPIVAETVAVTFGTLYIVCSEKLKRRRCEPRPDRADAASVGVNRVGDA